MRSSDVSLQLLKLWDDRPSEGQLFLLWCAAGEEVSVRTGHILGTIQVGPGRSQLGCEAMSPFVFPPHLPTFTFPSNYSSWGTLIHSKHTCIVLKMWGKLEEKNKVPEAETFFQVQHEWVRMRKTVGF